MDDTCLECHIAIAFFVYIQISKYVNFKGGTNPAISSFYSSEDHQHFCKFCECFLLIASVSHTWHGWLGITHYFKQFYQEVYM